MTHVPTSQAEFLARRDELQQSVDRRQTLPLLTGVLLFAGPLAVLAFAPFHVPLALAAGTMAVASALLIWSATSAGKRRAQLIAELGLECPSCGAPALDEAYEILLAQGRCSECGTVLFTIDETSQPGRAPRPGVRPGPAIALAYEALPYIGCVVILIAGALIPMPGVAQVAVSIGAFVVWIWGMARFSATGRRRHRHERLPVDRLPTREDLRRRIQRYRRLAKGAPLAMVGGVILFLVVVSSLVRAGLDYPPRVGVPFLLSYFVLVFGIATFWEGWLVLTLNLECPSCGAELVGGHKHFSGTANTLKTWSCYACGQPVAQ